MTMAELRVLPYAFDELLTPTGAARPAAAALVARLQQLGEAELRARQDLADLDILTMGITFTVYSDGVGIDRAWPFDVIPRVIDAVEWRPYRSRAHPAPRRAQPLHRRHLQRPEHRRRRRVSRRVSWRTRSTTAPQCRGVRPRLRRVGPHLRQRPRARRRRHDVRARGQPARAVGRELRAREPAHLQAGLRRPVRAPEHPSRRRLHRRAPRAAGSLASEDVDEPSVGRACSRRASTTPPTSSTRFLAQRMGVELVEGRDLVVGDDDCVYMRTIAGPHRST